MLEELEGDAKPMRRCEEKGTSGAQCTKRGGQAVEDEEPRGVVRLPRAPDLSRETKRKAVEFLEKVEQCGRWPPQACTTMCFLIPKKRHRGPPHCSSAHL